MIEKSHRFEIKLGEKGIEIKSIQKEKKEFLKEKLHQ